MKWTGRHGLLNHSQSDCLFNNPFQTNMKTSKLQIIVILWWETTRWPLNSPHTGPVMRKAFPCQEVIVRSSNSQAPQNTFFHYIDVIMTTMASQITSLTVVYSTVYSDADQRKHQSSASLAFVCGIHRYRWIPRTKGQLRGKSFHLMTSSWVS